MKLFRRSHFGAAVAIILMCISGCAEGEEKLSFIRIEYLISEVMGPPEALTIMSDGTARLKSYSNLLSRGVEPVGLFETRFDAVRLRALEKAIDRPPFETIPDKKSVADGYRAVQVTRNSGTTERRTDHWMAIDPAMQTLIARLDRVAEEVKQHPIGNLLMQAGSVHADPDGTLEAVLTFTNPGTQTLQMVNPAYPEGAVLAVRIQPDVPDAQVKSTDISEAKAFEVHQAGGPTEAVVQLEPGGSLSLRVKFALGKRLTVPSLARLTYQQTAQEWKSKSVLATELYSPNTPIQ